MIGIVLCGGQSTRMGSDKGLLKALPPPDWGIGPKHKTNTWAQIAVNKLSELQLPIIISVNKHQLPDYSAFFPALQLVADNDSLLIKGPLSGVLSVHVKYPQEDMLILACDMPLMEPGLIKELLTQYNTQKANDAFIFTNDGEPEPLCGIYKAKALANIHHLYKTNQLPRHSMKYMLEHISTYSIPLPESKKNCFRNFNAHSELNGL